MINQVKILDKIFSLFSFKKGSNKPFLKENNEKRYLKITLLIITCYLTFN
ncbi:MAG: hypothetical protein ACI9XO_002515 [Paraglaciecola sp.]|jgi:hypothetical protein